MLIFDLFLSALLIAAQDEAATDANRLQKIEIIAQEEKVDVSPKGYQLKDYAGKKATQIRYSEKSVAPTNVFRSSLAELPGVLSTDVNNDSWVSLSYRGLGDPHESYNLNILKNGLPTAADIYGYPGHYFSPPPESLESIHFIRGGAGLLYGPQPMGVLNWIQREASANNEPAESLISLRGGSFGMWSGYASHSHSGEKWGLLASINRRQADGFRSTNGDFGITNGRLSFVYEISERHSLLVEYDHYRGRHGEPGGLGRQTGGNYLGIDTTWRGSTLANDRVNIDRDQSTVSLRSKWSPDVSSQFDTSYTLLRRDSFRQNLGLNPGESAFGRIPTANTNTIQSQYFRTLQSQLTTNVKHSTFDLDQKWVSGLSFYHVDSPFDQSQGAAATAVVGTPQRALDRTTRAFSVFTENQFQLGAWRLTPGVRFESIRIGIQEELNTADPGNLRQEEERYNLPLFSFGSEYQLSDESQLYAQFSQGFKPITFQDAVPLSPGDTISEDLKAGKIHQYEVGWKTQSSTFAADLSVFYFEFENRFGRSGNQILNIGRSVHYGIDSLLHWKLSPQWSAYWSQSLLQAEIKDNNGATILRGKRPQYAPQLLSRVGLTWNYAKDSRLQLQSQFVSSQAGDDTNTPNFYIPSFTIVDLMGDTKVYETQRMQLFASYGIMNIGGEKYITRIRPNGIEPGAPTSFYLGMRSTF